MHDDELRYLDVMERITRLERQADGLPALLHAVLSEMLELFACDRAFVHTPCDPAAPAWRVLMACVRDDARREPEIIGNEMPMTAECAALMAACLAAPGAYAVGGGPPGGAFGAAKGMVLVLHLRLGAPWLLGVERAAPCTAAERRLFEVIGRRLAEAGAYLHALERMREAEARLRVLMEHASEAVIVLERASGCFVMVNRRAAELFRHDAARLCAGGFAQLLVGHAEEFERRLWAALDDGGAGFEWLFRDGSGRVLACAVRPVRLPAADGELVCASIVDIGARLAEEARKRLLHRALEQTADTVMITDRAGSIEFVNHAFETVTGYGRDEACGKSPRILKSGRHPLKYYRKLWGTVLAGRVFVDTLINRRKDGSLYYEEKTITPIKDERGGITHFVSTGKDISDRIQANERLQYLTHYDALTELPNRALLLDRLHHAIAQAARHRRTLAVLCLDLDQFKTINDSLGHDAGDKLLQAIAGRLVGCMRDGDTVARLAGDEFAVLLEDVSIEEEVPRVARKLLEVLAEPVRVDLHELVVTASVGISVFPADGRDARSLLKHADTAMYRAKEQGRNAYQFYMQEMSDKVFQRLSLENQLRQAVQRGEFCLYYQPQRDLRSGRIHGVEALLRWRHPERGMVEPGEFIHVLEELGLIEQVGAWVLREACAQVHVWHAAGADGLRICVNLSPRQVARGDIADAVAALLDEYRMPHGLLELEITEHTLMRDEPRALEVLQRLAALGVRLALDDFGVGYSSLVYLRRFPIHTVKIDRSFIHAVDSNVEDATIVRGIIGIAQSLRLQVVAEGAEAAAQQSFLRALGCDLLQGWVVSPPLPAGEMEAMLFAEA